MNQIIRPQTKQIRIGNRLIGNNNTILIQSMTNTLTSNIEAVVDQISGLQDAGCDIVRVAVPDMESAKSINKIKARIKIPIVADIHFDYKLALESIENGADKIRINPGNIGSNDRVIHILNKATEFKIPIRIGLNSGSLPQKYIDLSTEDAICKSVLEYINLFERNNFTNIVISAKSSNMMQTIALYKMISQKTDYPLHLGVTETGPVTSGIVKSSIGIGHLLMLGIGDTIRVSLTDNPVQEVKIAKNILQSLGYYKNKPEIISCPTCGRCKIDVIGIVNQLEPLISNIDKNIKIAVMGCAVNGPGEAKDADIGMAGGDKCALLFKKGQIICKIPEDQIISRIVHEIEQF